jgi:uncharacterized membrane-anchored protein YhcB (DUF1043 family)
MDITIIGWVWFGIVVGIILGIIICGILTQSRISELESELVHQRFIRDSLKEEIFRLDNQVKPKPRKKR